MKISTRGRYALRFLIDLALHGDEGYVSLKDVSARQGISVKYLEQIIALLGKDRFLLSVRGPQGGYRLARKPSEYTVREILMATEGSLAPVACLDPGAEICPRAEVCSTLKLWKGLDSVINDYLSGITLQDLVPEHDVKVDKDHCLLEN